MCDGNCLYFGYMNLTDDDVKGKKVLEVGSCNVNGSLRDDVMKHEPADYVGVDIVAGPGVDFVMSSDDVLRHFGKETFDVVISTCALEHIADWKRAISNMKNVCREGGVLLIIVPSVWPWHNHPYDFWRYSMQDIKNIFADCEMLIIEEKASYHGPKIGDLVYAKIRKPVGFKEADLSKYLLYSIPEKKRI